MITTYSFGPLKPSEGDFNAKWNSKMFKIVCEGLARHGIFTGISK